MVTQAALIRVERGEVQLGILFTAERVVAVLVAIHDRPREFRRGQMPRSERRRTLVNCLAADS